MLCDPAVRALVKLHVRPAARQGEMNEPPALVASVPVAEHGVAVDHVAEAAGDHDRLVGVLRQDHGLAVGAAHLQHEAAGVQPLALVSAQEVHDVVDEVGIGGGVVVRCERDGHVWMPRSIETSGAPLGGMYTLMSTSPTRSQ